MNDPSQNASISPRERASTYLYFSSLYFVTVGVLYLWGYWSAFNVNILEYLSLADIIKSTAYPIASVFVFLAVGAVLGEALSGNSPLPPGGGRDSLIGRLLRRFLPWLILLYATGTLALLALGPVEKWRALPVLFALPAYAYAKKSDLLRSVIPQDSARSLAIFLLAALPTFAFGQGRLRAHAVIDGETFEYVISPVDNVTVTAGAEASQLPRLVGHAGEFLFLFEPGKGSLAIVKFEGGKAFVLKHFERPKPAPKVGSNRPLNYHQ